MENQENPGKKKFYKRWWFWAIVIVILLLLVGASGSSSSKGGENGAASVPPAQQQTYKVGDQIKLGSSVITVNSVSMSSGGEFGKPSAGNEWLNLNITIQNTSSSQQYVTTLGQMFVRDGQGNSYQVAVTDKTIDNPNSSLDGAIIANSKRTGWVGFEIPKGATGLQFQYNGSEWGGGTVLVDLGS